MLCIRWKLEREREREREREWEKHKRKDGKKMLIAFLPYAGREKDEALVFVHKNIRKYAWFIRIFEIASNHNNLLATFGLNDTIIRYISGPISIETHKTLKFSP